MEAEFYRPLHKPADTRIVLLVMDGLGGLPHEPGGQTALEAARTPNLDALAREGICGLHVPVAPGVTPGSGPSHLALFGYDPVRFQVGRGVLSALGVGFDLQPGDVPARGNFCTVDERGRVTDRRAGRIPTETNVALLDKLRRITLDGAEILLQPVKEYRFLFVLRGEGLSPDVEETDPQLVGVAPRDPIPTADTPAARRTSQLVRHFVEGAREILAEEHPANMVLLRGFDQRPEWPTIGDLYGVRAAAIAGYPMYRGVAKLVGMTVLETGSELPDEFATLEAHWGEFDYYYLHAKPIDSAGEDGDVAAKIARIEEVDALVPRLRALEPDVIVVTGDHSTPAPLKYHSWHPVPLLLWSRYCRADEVDRFGERACMRGGLGPRMPAVEIMPLALANALRLEKFGA